ncbi:dCTP deaminase [Ruegeria sp.]|uniref:dCTP deaminase n=1 Tax=Ruegeria sp. TaxID=1879320 RepID=UPI003AFFBEF0
MAILGRKDIGDRIATGAIKIEPFDKTKIEPASYDCRIGDVLAAGAGRHVWGEGDEFILESNSWASVSSEEFFELPNSICASYGIRSGLARRGVIAFGGPQIDPGYKGKIFVSLYNPTLEPIILQYGQVIMSVIFYELSSEDEHGYTGPYQGQKDFPSQDVEFMMRMRSRNLADVIDNVETLDHSVKNLASNLKILTSDVHEIRQIVNDAKPWLKVIGWILGAAGVAAVGWIVMSLLQSFFGTPPAP